jgi:isopropylmalate/homocitrate/citramalate synthase
VRPLYSGKACLVKYIFSFGWQTSKNSQLSNFFKFCIILHTDKKGTEMTEQEFYAQIQEDYFREFAGTELSEVFICTNDHDEFFEFDDVPF